MAEREKPSITTLSVELQRQMAFEFTPTREWLINDEFTQVGGIEHGELLPARARVSKDGARFEIGARVQDLEGLLELNRILSPSVQTVDTIINFWQNHPKFTTRVEGEWVFIGANIEPTPEGLETEYNAVNFAYDVVLESAISGRTYVELARDEKWYGDCIKDIEKPGQARTGLFGRNVESEEETTEQPEENTACEIKPTIAADKLRDFPLDSYRTSLRRTPGTLTRNGRTKELKSMWIIAHNGSEAVDMIDSDAQYDDAKKEWTHDDTRLQLPIPEGVEIKTVADLAKLKKVQVLDEDRQLAQELDVNITVEDNSFRVVSTDGAFNLEVRTLACTDCQLPYWKFRWPNREEAEKDGNPYKEFGMHSTSAGGVGGYQCHVETPEGQKLYCYDCVTKLESTYLEEHPTARRSTAIDIAKRKLAEAGYPDVKILDTQVWRMKPGQWDLFTYIDYERDGKTIRRHTGIPTLTDEEEFEPNMRLRDYVDFRYKA